MAIYGIVRISTQKQNMQRQIRNIKAAYPNAIIIKEIYTGTKLKGRKDFEQLINRASWSSARAKRHLSNDSEL